MLDSEEEVEHTVTPNVTRSKARLPHSQVKLKNDSMPFKSTKPGTKRRTATVEEDVMIPIMPTAGNSTRGSVSNLKLPDFMRAGWASALLPTLYDSLGRSRKPFEHYCKGPEVIKKLQAVVDVVWPETDYKVKWTDDACQKVNTHIL